MWLMVTVNNNGYERDFSIDYPLQPGHEFVRFDGARKGTLMKLDTETMRLNPTTTAVTCNEVMGKWKTKIYVARHEFAKTYSLGGEGK